MRKSRTLSKINPGNIYISGDINRQYYKLIMKLDMRNIKDSHIIILGNFGIGSLSKSIEKENLNKINNKLIKNNNFLYLLLGDLDNIDLYNSYKRKYSNIRFTDEYDIVKIHGINFMFIGGSTNMKRVFSFKNNKRIKPTVFREFDVKHNISVDVVLSHDNVDFIYPYNLHNLKSISKYDKWIYNDIKKKRIKLTKSYETLKDRKCDIKTWYSGKYNKSIEERKGGINFIQLEKMELVKLKI